ncbi:F-box only protein 36-like isoform X2 [Physella acuta]|uniref:F-box only protein 36-like isoform X2 n=1 Tax=Physella acuta TaxID=109671 RepID=UPI0027DDA86F|nr:F-box only protein 36-like isoform X2 [Physella acuta]
MSSRQSMKSSQLSMKLDLTGWKAKCAPWMAQDGSLYQVTDVAPAPSKDFLQLFITPEMIHFRIWRIIPPTRADANQQPTDMKCTYDEFPDDTRMRGEIARTLGEHELHFVDRLILGHIDCLNRLPRKVLLRIIFNLDLTAVSKLGQVNRMFRELCSSDTVWSKIYMDHSTAPITQELLMLTDKRGWKEVFFMNKLQLQKTIHRMTDKKAKSGDTFLTS